MPTLPTSPPTIQLRYAQLEQLVEHLLEAHADRKSPLSARFRLFRQRGFPPNVTVLAKTRFAYGLEATLQVTLAFLMVDAFIPQEVVPTVITRNWDELTDGFRNAFAMIEKEGPDLASINDERKVLLLYPRNLHAFTLQKGLEADSADMVALAVLTARQARERLFGDRHADKFAPVTLIDLQRLATWLRTAFLEARWSGPEPFKAFADGGPALDPSAPALS